MDMTDAEWDEQEERAERLSELKTELADDLAQFGVHSERMENDLYVHGPLSIIMEFCQANRSEIEELGV